MEFSFQLSTSWWWFVVHWIGDFPLKRLGVPNFWRLIFSIPFSLGGLKGLTTPNSSNKKFCLKIKGKQMFKRVREWKPQPGSFNVLKIRSISNCRKFGSTKILRAHLFSSYRGDGTCIPTEKLLFLGSGWKPGGLVPNSYGWLWMSSSSN